MYRLYIPIFIIFFLLIGSCQYSSKIKPLNDSNVHTFSTIPLKAEEGYEVHPITGDTLELPEYLTRGLAFEGNRIEVDPAKLKKYPVKMIHEKKAGAPQISFLKNSTKPYKVGKKLDFKVEKLTNLEGVFINEMNGDSIYTGKPIVIYPIKLDITLPLPVKADKPFWDKKRDQQISNWQDEQGLLSNTLWDVLEDKQGRLWMGTEGAGFSIFDGAYFHNFNPSSGITSGMVLKFTEDNEQNIWLHTFNEGLMKYDGFEYWAYNRAAGLPAKTVFALYQDFDGATWMATDNSGICKITGDTAIFYQTPQKILNEIQGIEQTANGDLWFIGYNGMTKFDGTDFFHYSFEALEDIKGQTSFVDSKGNLWLGTLNHGLLKYDGKFFYQLTTESGTIGNTIRYITEDQNGLLWVGTTDGINSFDDEMFTEYGETSGLASPRAFGLNVSRDNSILVAQNGGGLAIIKQKGISHLSKTQGLPSDDITGTIPFDEMTYHTIFGEGLTIQSGDSLLNYTTAEGIFSDQIRSLAVNDSGEIFMLPYVAPGGYSTFDGSTFRHFIIDDPHFEAIYNSTIMVDSQERLWLGLNGIGTGYVENNQFISISPSDGLVGEIVDYIYEDSRRNIWIATPKGISKYDGKYLTNYTIREGLLSNNIDAIVEDAVGHIWVSAGHYMHRFGNEILDIIVDSERKPSRIGGKMVFSNLNTLWTASSSLHQLTLDSGVVHTVSLTKQSGLKNGSFDLLTINKQQELLASDENGYDIINLNIFKARTVPPKINFSYLEVNETYRNFKSNSIAISRFSRVPATIQLSADENQLTIHFAANQWQDPSQIEYSYIFKEIDKQWSIPSIKTSAVYRNLPYGNFTFQVRSKGESGQWSEPISLNIYIKPPWYLTIAAKTVYVIIAILSFFVILNLRTAQLRRKQEVLEKEIKAATKEITAQKDRAERSEKYKEEFLANMSHEIRTPIHAISGILKILRRNNHPAFQDKFLNAMTKSTDNLSKLLNDVLDLSKIESGKLQLNEEPFDLKETVTDCIELLKERAVEKGLNIVSSFSENLPPRVIGDALRISQILINLISNAIKFSNQGVISVLVQQEDEGIKFAVSDNGIGISKADQKRVFVSFNQVKSKQSPQGTGLGLAITKQLVLLQKGEIYLTSELGKKSTFYFILPLQPFEGEMMEINKSERELKELAKNFIGLKVLLVEDTEFNIMVTTDDLNWYFPGLSIDVAQNGKEALDLFVTHDYDIVLMDVQMPTMDGYESTREIRELEKQKNLKRKPVIAMTASLLEKDIQKCYQYGMDDYLPKPYKASELVLKIVEKLSI